MRRRKGTDKRPASLATENGFLPYKITWSLLNIFSKNQKQEVLVTRVHFFDSFTSHSFYCFTLQSSWSICWQNIQKPILSWGFDRLASSWLFRYWILRSIRWNLLDDTISLVKSCQFWRQKTTLQIWIDFNSNRILVDKWVHQRKWESHSWIKPKQWKDWIKLGRNFIHFFMIACFLSKFLWPLWKERSFLCFSWLSVERILLEKKKSRKHQQKLY